MTITSTPCHARPCNAMVSFFAKPHCAVRFITMMIPVEPTHEDHKMGYNSSVVEHPTGNKRSQSYPPVLTLLGPPSEPSPPDKAIKPPNFGWYFGSVRRTSLLPVQTTNLALPSSGRGTCPSACRTARDSAQGARPRCFPMIPGAVLLFDTALAPRCVPRRGHFGGDIARRAWTVDVKYATGLYLRHLCLVVVPRLVCHCFLHRYPPLASDRGGWEHCHQHPTRTDARIDSRTYHSGQVPDTLISQGSIHCGWNLWLQGSTRTSSPRVKSSVHIEQPSLSSLGALTCTSLLPAPPISASPPKTVVASAPSAATRFGGPVRLSAIVERL